MSAITTHVLDTSRGLPAAGVRVLLARKEPGGWCDVAAGVTDDDGRVTDLLLPGVRPERGIHRLTFETAGYFAEAAAFYPSVVVEFAVVDPSEHYHVPLLLSPYGYSTYRGS